MMRQQQFLRFFTRALASLLSAGIPLLTALENLAEQQEEEWEKKLVKRLARNISKGDSLSSAMEKETKLFSKFVIGLVTVGEQTGTLVQNLERIAQCVEENIELRLKLYSALTYPLFLLVATITGAVLLVKIFLPPFLPVFQEMNNLPFPTRFFVFLARLFGSPVFWFCIAGLGGSCYLFIRSRGDSFFLNIPLAGPIIKKSGMAQITSTLGTAYSSGFPISKGLELATSVLENEVLRDFIQNSRLALARGEKLSSFFLENKQYVPPFIGHMLAVAEATGQMDRIMLKCTQILKEEMDCSIQRLSRYLEPGILFVLGGFVCLMMMSVLLPLYGMLEVSAK